jgi:hypothetical protein
MKFPSSSASAVRTSSSSSTESVVVRQCYPRFEAWNHYTVQEGYQFVSRPFGPESKCNCRQSMDGIES